MSKTSDRKSKKSRQVVKKKGSRKKSKKVMKGGYGRGKNHKGGAQKLKEFFLQFASEGRTSKKSDRYNVTHNPDNAEYHFVSPNQIIESLIKQVVTTEGLRSKVEYKLDSNKDDTKDTIENLFLKYVKDDYNTYRNPEYVKNTIKKLEKTKKLADLIKELNTLIRN